MFTCQAPSWLPVWEYVQCVESHNKAAILLNIDGLSSALNVPALINIPYSIYYVFILAEELHYSNIKLYIKYQFHTKRVDVFKARNIELRRNIPQNTEAPPQSPVSCHIGSIR